MSYVAARKNLDETAFFFPHLLSDKEGVVRLEFTMPETLAQWRFLGFAHDRQLRAGLLEGEAVTAKDLVVQPNPPRFLHEGDLLEFTVKVSNQSAQRQSGKVQLTLADARNDKSLDALFGNTLPERDFDVPARQSRSYSWKLSVPDRAERVLVYKAVASTGQLSDGEEAYLPVLPRRVLVTEALPLQLRDAQTKRFEFPSLLRSAESKTIQHESLTVQMNVPSRVVCRHVVTMFDRESVAMLGTGFQPSFRQRAGQARHRLEPEDPPGLRAVERNARLGQPSGKKSGSQGRVVGGDALDERGPGGKPIAARYRDVF